MECDHPIRYSIEILYNNTAYAALLMERRIVLLCLKA